MKPLIPLFAALLLVPPLFAQEQKSSDLGGGFGEITKAISAAKKKSAVESAKAAAEAADAQAKAQPWTFEDAKIQLKDGPGQLITLATKDVDGISGRWVLAAYTDDQANAEGIDAKESFASLKAPRRAIEFSHQGFRFAGEKAWRAYDGGIDAEMRLIEEGAETFRVTYCGKPERPGELLCKTTSTRRSDAKADAAGKPKDKAKPVVSYSKYVRP